MQPQAYNPNSELQRVRRENELLEKKLSKAISKRNYYAKLYYSCMLERDKAMAEREGAIKELHKVLTQLHQQGHSSASASDSLSDVSRLISDSSSGSNPTPLNPSRSTSLASLLSSFQSHTSTSLIEDSGLCTGNSTSSLTDIDPTGTQVLEGTLLSTNLATHNLQPTGKTSDVRNLLEECAEALEGIADLRLGGSVKSVKHVPLNDNPTPEKQDKLKYKLNYEPVKLPNVSAVPANRSLLARKARTPTNEGKSDERKFVDTFEIQLGGTWPRSNRDQRGQPAGDMESLPTSLLEEYAQDASSLSWTHQSGSKLRPCDSSEVRSCLRTRTCKLDRIEEMSCESSHSDNSLDPKVKESKSDSFRDMFETEKSNSILAPAGKKVSYSNLTTHELRQILFQLSTSRVRDSITHLEFYRSSFEDEWVLLLLSDEIRLNKSLRTLCIIECALYTAHDNLVQVMTAIKHSQLNCLSLARNGLTDGIVDTLQVTEFFKIGLPLTVLDLSENFISPEAVSVLISLSKNSKCEIKVHTQYTLTPSFNSQSEML